jgi:hypothetical protein
MAYFQMKAEHIFKKFPEQQLRKPKAVEKVQRL